MVGFLLVFCVCMSLSLSHTRTHVHVSPIHDLTKKKIKVSRLETSDSHSSNSFVDLDKLADF